jgi:predicted short-subunit dehydrogenase-like oxidoreductase (DUF2520 family)
LIALWILCAAVGLIAAASITEAVLKRGKKRPLACHAVSQQRYDQRDAAKQLPEHHVKNAPTWTNRMEYAAQKKVMCCADLKDIQQKNDTSNR